MNLAQRSVAALALGLAAFTAQADILTFSYTALASSTFSGNAFNLSGSLTGTLAADGNTFSAIGGSDFLLNGAALFGPTEVPTVFKASPNFSSGPTPPALDFSQLATVTLDGTAIDLSALVVPTLSSGFALLAGTPAKAVGAPDLLILIGPGGFGDLAAYDVESWKASIVKTDVPEPATLSLVGLALLGLAARRRRS